MVTLVKKLRTPFELLLINDGSTDETARICHKLERQYDFIRFIDKPHTGVSDTRNAGIKAARGKYILFLDADDSLDNGSADRLYEFFEECGDICDLVTYPIETHYHGVVLAPHFRYKYMTYSGIYDLRDLSYIGQTTMNIMVRNRFENNILFDDKMTFSEDQRYCYEVTRDKLKIGFCADAKYIYNRAETSSSGKLSGSCYIFEQSMKMFEDMFSDLDPVPKTYQGLYINDLAWKLRSNILYPYHYKGVHFTNALSRIKSLLHRVDNSVILEHPDINFYHKYYWLKMKPNNNVGVFCEPDMFGLKDDSGVILSQNDFEIVVTRIREDNGTFIFRGFIKSAVLLFSEKPTLYADINGRREAQELYDSAHSYYLCRSKTQKFYAFCLEADISTLERLSFSVAFGGYEYPCRYYFMPKAPFSHYTERYTAPVGSIVLDFDKENARFTRSALTCRDALLYNSTSPLLSSKMKRMRKKAAILRCKSLICLYYDCRGVEKDNGWYRFKEDYFKDDGVRRIYIYDDKIPQGEFAFPNIDKRDLVPFGSAEHKLYCLACKKIVTAYIEDINIFPFSADELYLYSDFFDFEVEYIQHGILHASLPWKYTPEMITADKVTVSTDYEQTLFVEKYHFRKEDITPRLMPRLKMLDRTARPQKKILFAPSWRQYLIGPDIEGKWQPLKSLFVSSDYFKNISDFLNSEELDELLRQNDYTLDFKLHPIFEIYRNCFDIHSKRVKIVDTAVPIEQYEIFITDFSSFVFDFIYLGRKVFSFIPDKMQFECGMNSYREIEQASRKYLAELHPAHLDRIFSEQNTGSSISFFC